MNSMFATGQGRRIALASVLVIALLGLAIGITIWRYQNALGASSDELNARADLLAATAAATTFWHEREAMNEYLLAPDAQIAREAGDLRRDFSRTLGTTQVNAARERALVLAARRANDRFYSVFQANRAAAGRGLARELAVVKKLNAAEDAVLGPLESLHTVNSEEVGASAAARRSASTQALVAALIAGGLALVAGTAFALYALRLLSRVVERGDELRRSIDALSDRDERISDTASVLSEVAAELRAAVKESAATTAEQSSAVAETSATIAELAATATSIADNARASAAAAEQTGHHQGRGCRTGARILWAVKRPSSAAGNSPTSCALARGHPHPHELLQRSRRPSSDLIFIRSERCRRGGRARAGGGLR